MVHEDDEQIANKLVGRTKSFPFTTTIATIAKLITTEYPSIIAKPNQNINHDKNRSSNNQPTDSVEQTGKAGAEGLAGAWSGPKDLPLGRHKGIRADRLTGAGHARGF
jgi:hypothetical protein